MIGQPRKHFCQTTSTNTIAHQWALEGAPHGAIVTAAAQTAGVGRRGREWISAPGKGIYLSIILRPQADLLPQQCTLLLAVAACRALEKSAEVHAQTKWPNDILLQGRKVGGVLCSGEWRHDELAFIIAGIGLNINQTKEDLPERPIYPATSLREISGQEQNVEDVLSKVLSEMNALEKNNDWLAIHHEFQQRCIFMGEVIGLQEEEKKYFGIAQRIDEEGFLWLQTATGLRRFVNGEIVD
ncbi:MAG: biotin--[acetyl-CoA-carboxylase] ligase [Abditibacteriaceae bacterium]